MIQLYGDTLNVDELAAGTVQTITETPKQVDEEKELQKLRMDGLAFQQRCERKFQEFSYALKAIDTKHLKAMALRHDALAELYQALHTKQIVCSEAAFYARNAKTLTEAQRAKLFDAAFMVLDTDDKKVALWAMMPIKDMVKELIENHTKMAKTIARTLESKLEPDYD
jgi:hypothetical protein